MLIYILFIINLLIIYQLIYSLIENNVFNYLSNWIDHILHITVATCLRVGYNPPSTIFSLGCTCFDENYILSWSNAKLVSNVINKAKASRFLTLDSGTWSGHCVDCGWFVTKNYSFYYFLNPSDISLRHYLVLVQPSYEKL